MAFVFIGLGSNLARPVEQLGRALKALEELSERGWKRSSLYRTPPMGPQDQPDYINAVAGFETSLQPLQLLDRLQQIERQQGRERGRRWGERTLDLDLLFYGEERIDHPDLKVPHPGVALRGFVLIPLAEIVGETWAAPGLGALKPLLANCEYSTVEKLREVSS